MPRNTAGSKIGNGVISLLWQLRCHCNPDHNQFSSLSNTTVVSIFPNPCLWRRSLRSNLGGIDLEKLYRATLRWLDWIFWGWYLPTLSIKCVGMSKDMEKRLPQLYYIKMKIGYDQGCNDIGVVIATKWRHYLFYFQQYFSALGTVLPKSFTGAFTYDSCLNVREV